MTFGLLMILEDLIRLVWGPNPLSATTVYATSRQSISIAGDRYPAYNLVIIAVGIIAAVFLWAFIYRTRFGVLAARDFAGQAHGLGARRQRQSNLHPGVSRWAASWLGSAAPSSCPASPPCWAWASTRWSSPSSSSSSVVSAVWRARSPER